MRLIDADALKKVFHAEWDDVLVWDESGETTADEFCNLVDAAPTIDEQREIDYWHNLASSYADTIVRLCEPKTGKWIYGEEGTFGNPYGHYDCSVCGERRAYRENYCPNCGARMTEGSEE